jgi:hypothetical protein
MQCVRQGKILTKPDACPDDVYSIMKSCWDHTADARIRPKVIIRNIRGLLNQGVLIISSFHVNISVGFMIQTVHVR